MKGIHGFSTRATTFYNQRKSRGMRMKSRHPGMLAEEQLSNQEQLDLTETCQKMKAMTKEILPMAIGWMSQGAQFDGKQQHLMRRKRCGLFLRSVASSLQPAVM